MNYPVIRNFLDITCNTGFRFKDDGTIEADTNDTDYKKRVKADE